MVITALQAEDSVVFTAFSDHGERLDANQCQRLFDLPGAVTGSVDGGSVAKDLAAGLSDAERPIFEELNAGNRRWFDLEIEQLERWTGDRRDGLKDRWTLRTSASRRREGRPICAQSSREASASA